MRAIILILILAVVVILAGIGTGFIDINQIRGAKAPEVCATQNGVVAKGGQTPAFDVETGSVTVGTKDAHGQGARGAGQSAGRRTRPAPARNNAQ